MMKSATEVAFFIASSPSLFTYTLSAQVYV